MASDIYSMLERAYGQGSLGTEDINDQLLHGYRPGPLPDWMRYGAGQFALPPRDQEEIRNIATKERPTAKWQEGVAAGISPVVGNMFTPLREGYDAARQGDWASMLEHVGPTAIGMAVPIPGLKGAARLSEPRPLLRPGPTLPPSIRATMHPEADVRLPVSYPQDQVPVHTISEAQRAKAEAAGYNTERMLYWGGTRKFRGVRMADEDKDITQSYPYLADRPQISDHYAFGEMPNVHPRLMYDDRNRGDKLDRWAAKEAPQITPLWAKRDKVLVVPYDKLGSGGLDEAGLRSLERQLDHEFGKKYYEVYMEDIADAARSKGYNMVEYRGMSDWGGKQNQYIPLVPNAVRSPYARYDPEHAGSGNIMAGIAGPALMVPALASLLSQYAPDTKE